MVNHCVNEVSINAIVVQHGLHMAQRPHEDLFS